MNRNKWVSFPYMIWMIMFIVIPIILVFWYSIFVKVNEGNSLSLENYQRFFEPIYLGVLWHSIKLALISTVICLILGYPMAFIISRANLRHRNILVLLTIIPMWMNFLLRTYAWLTLLERSGLINKLLVKFGLPMLNILYTDYAVVLGMVYNFLPFMILPIYTVLIKIDKSYIEAAYDLGANKRNVFTKIIFPLSLPGVVSGIIMVFMPAITTFVISRLLGGGQYTLIGNLIEQQYLNVYDWNFGSTISIVMMIIILISMAILSKYNEDKEGVGLW